MKPVVQHVCRILFGLCKKVDAKLDELLEVNIIEEVMEGPSGWILSLVVVHKSGRDVRVCVDMHQANKAIVSGIQLQLSRSCYTTRMVVPCSVRQISSGLFTRFYSVRKVATSLPLSRTKVLLQVLDVWSDLGTGGIPSDH